MSTDTDQISQGGWLLNADEACRILGGGITKKTLYRWCEQGLIPYIRVGRRIFFVRQKLEEWKETKSEDNGGKQ